MVVIYDDRSWFKLIFAWRGSVLPNIWTLLFVWVAIVLLSFLVLDLEQWKLGTDEHSTLGGTMSFLLIFRANQAHARFWEGRTNITWFFSDLRDFLLFMNLYVKGGAKTVAWDSGVKRRAVDEDDHDELARKMRVDCARLCIAFAVLLKSHTRMQLDGYCFGSISKETKWDLDWDRLRLRQLLRDWEFQMVDSRIGNFGKPNTTEALVNQFRDCYDEGPPADWPETFKVDTKPLARAHLAVAYLLKEQLMENMNDTFNSSPHGIKERLIPLLANLLKESLGSFECVSVIMGTPLPLPYACLCKLLLTVWMMTFPFVEDTGLGPFGGVFIPIVVMLALLGIDSISTELENPFGDDANDLDVLEQIGNLESEAMAMFELCGDDKARSAFVWRRVPQRVTDMSCKPVRRQLVFAELAAEDFVTATGETPRISPRKIRGGSLTSSKKSVPRSYSGTALDNDNL